jgi:hypothetical protein
MGNDWVERHKTIKKAVDEEEDCVNIYDIANRVNYDFQSVMRHFEVMKIDGYGNFVDKEKKIFCTVKTSSKVFSYITKDEINSQL